jgi:diaminohydroxyphosphoribosylaminopyrimidine deaminase/5-amino-6-(5-phosphoribosylamino)uracil reductase
MQINDDFFMALAIKEAWKYQGLTYPNPSVGCVIVQNNAILSIKAHQKAGAPHAEVLALQDSFSILSKDTKILQLKDSNDIHIYLLENHNNIFENITLYTTLEPCNHIGQTPSCATLISSLNIQKVIIGSKDIHSSGGIEKIKKQNIQIIQDIQKEKCDNLLHPFLCYKKSQFVFFKYASTLNGSIKGNISNQKSKKFVHKLRDKIDLLVIGGNTVRVDRPTLDAREVKGKAPDIFIYSKQKDFDKTIPLFNIPNRKVIISDDISIIEKYNFIMIEGVDNMMESFSKYIDYYLIFLSSSLSNNENLKINKRLKYLNIQEINDNISIWAKAYNE